MDIKQLQYFITIVDCDCNLSRAAEKIHISQSALSQQIKLFEEKEKIFLFERGHRKFNRLSPAGEAFYRHAKTIVAQYDSMLTEMRGIVGSLVGEVKIGIPPFVISTIFPEIISQFRIETPDIKINLFELGAFELQKRLLSGDIDIAILLKPITLEADVVEEVLLIENELCAFMWQNHPLAKKEQLTWSQLQQAPLSIFDDTFMIHHLLMNKFKEQQINPDVLITSSCWDFLLRSTLNTDLITILPSHTLDYFSADQIKMIHFKSPIKWQAVMCRNKKQSYRTVEQHVFDEIDNYFKNQRMD